MAAPLTEEHKRQIDAALAQLKEAREMIARAKLAGIDVAEQEAEAAKLDDQLRKLRQAFFPGR